VQDRDMVAMEV